MRRAAACLLIAVFIGLGLGLVTNYLKSFHNVSLTLAPDVSVNVFQYNPKDGAGYNVSSTPKYSVDSDKSIKLKNGKYVLVVNNGENMFNSSPQVVTITGQTKSLSVNPSYSSARLSNILSADKATIEASLINSYPSLNSFYTFSNEQLYDQGQWYSAALIPTSSNFDELKVVMKNVNNSWLVAAAPQVSLGQPSNPSIPLNVLEGADSN